MTGTENVFDGFALLGDDEEFDVDKIFGSGSDEPAPPPPALTLAEEVKSQPEPEQVQTETAESQPEPEHTLPAKTQEVPGACICCGSGHRHQQQGTRYHYEVDQPCGPEKAAVSVHTCVNRKFSFPLRPYTIFLYSGQSNHRAEQIEVGGENSGTGMPRFRAQDME